jgi:[protein-PII] uridylyltransferase
MVDLMRQAFHGGTAIFLFSPQKIYAFAAATGAMDELGLNIADARIVPLRNNWSLATFVVLEQSGGPLTDPLRLEQIKSRLIHALTTQAQSPVTVSRRVPRQVRMFPTTTIVAFSQDTKNDRTVMELVAGDRPGLLSEVGQVLRANQITIQTAKILTIGERAEDVFYITHEDGHPLDDAECEQLERALTEALSQPGSGDV